MKKFQYLFLIVCIFGIFPSIAVSEEIEHNVFVKIDSPFYPVENFECKVEFTIYNNGNNTFNGTLSNRITNEDVHWEEVEDNLTILPHNYSVVTRTVKPTYVGKLTVYENLRDMNGKSVHSTNYPANVHSLEAAAVIFAAIIASLALFVAIIKKS